MNFDEAKLNIQKATKGRWFVRSMLGDDMTVRDCFVAAPDCQGLAYDAEILGDDEYRDGIERKLADCAHIARFDPPTVAAMIGCIEALKALDRAYVCLMEAGRDRILALGGECDPADTMERSDPNLYAARLAVKQLEGLYAKG